VASPLVQASITAPVTIMRGASAAVNTATKNTNMLLRRKYRSIDDNDPNNNTKLPSGPLTWP